MERVGIIQSISDTTVYFLGYGTYLGEFDIDSHEFGFTDIIISLPKFQLDDGRMVHGVEFWWAKEEEIQYKIVEYENMGLIIEYI